MQSRYVRYTGVDPLRPLHPSTLATPLLRQLVTKTMVICLIYSAALPLMYALACAFMWLSMWIDRYNLLRQLALPPRSPDALIGLVLRIILPIALLVHLLCAVMFYSY